MSDEYGFIYLWRDRKHNRYYVGCHWGTTDDEYICSSRWMKQAYKHRPYDFKRKILSIITTNRNDLLEEEFRWLSMIKPEELRIKYYNIKQHHFGHWSNNPDTRSICQRISENTKAAINKPEIREKYLEGLKTRNTVHSIESRQQQAKKVRGQKRSIEYSKKLSERMKKQKAGKPFGSSETLTKVADTLSHYRVSCLCCRKVFNPGNFKLHLSTGKITHNKHYDATEYTFEHKTGLVEMCTRYELIHKYPEHKIYQGNFIKVIRGELKTIKGWRILE